jgi:chaperonin GroEL (HSP60 family)
MKGSTSSILKKDTTVITGKDVQMNNLAAAKTIASVVRSTLGPFGMDKMLVNRYGEAMVTNDGAEILKKMDITHPIGKIMVEIAKTQDLEVGDGTTSAVILSGSLLEKAYALIENGVHGTTIVSGFSKAADMAQEILDELAINVKPDDIEVLKKVALDRKSVV